MRWIVLALSIGTSVTSIIHGVFELLLSLPVHGAAEGNFKWLTGAALILSALLALTGGLIAFSRRRWGGVLLVVPALICFFVHPDIRIYGGLYLLGGIFAFFVKHENEYDEEDYGDYDNYDDEEYDDDDYDFEDEYNQEGNKVFRLEKNDDEDEQFLDEAIPNVGNVRKRTSRVAAASVSTQSPEKTILSQDQTLSEQKVRVRSSKYCPACGAIAAINHRFCPSCGTQLHVPPEYSEQVSSEEPAFSGEPASAPVAAVPMASSVTEITKESLLNETGLTSEYAEHAEKDEPTAVTFQEPSSKAANPFEKIQILLDEIPDKVKKDADAPSERLLVKPRSVLGDDDLISELNQEKSQGFNEENSFEVRPEGVRPDEFSQADKEGYNEKENKNHKVFVTPFKEEEPIPTQPLMISPDNSYKDFHNYSRRQKRRSRSVLRRVLGVVFLLSLMVGITWFLLGLRKLPPDELPKAPEEKVVQTEKTDVPPKVPPSNVIAEPIAKGHSENILTQLLVGELPKRGVVFGSGVNFRESHVRTSKSLARLGSGVSAELLDSWDDPANTAETWYNIRTGDKKEGWIHGAYFVPLREKDVISLPEGYTAALTESFGLTKSDAVAKFGTPAKSAKNSLAWKGLTMSLSADGKVTKVQITDSKYAFSNKVSVGLSSLELYKIMGYPSGLTGSQIRYIEKGKTGVSVGLKDGKIQSVTLDN